jgi:hypothetical protein
LSNDHRTTGATAGIARVLVDTVVAATEVVETMHARISPLQPTPADPMRGTARGITGFVYRSIRGVARLCGFGVSRLGTARTAAPISSSRGQALLAALNGVAGDHLSRIESPLAVPMRLRHRGRDLDLSASGLASVTQPTGRI